MSPLLSIIFLSAIIPSSVYAYAYVLVILGLPILSIVTVSLAILLRLSYAISYCKNRMESGGVARFPFTFLYISLPLASYLKVVL
jgi:hypothetical protein